MFKNILFICVGNICRSPLAEYWAQAQLQQQGKDVQVKSAGLAAMINWPIDAKSRLILDRYNIDSSAHRARQVTLPIMSEADIIFTMESWQSKELKQKFPSMYGKIFNFGKWRNEDIADPYKQSQEAFENVFILIEENWTLWQNNLWRK